MTLQRAVLIEQANRAGAEDLDRHSDDAPQKCSTASPPAPRTAGMPLGNDSPSKDPLRPRSRPTRIRLQMLVAERRAVISARDQGRFDDDVIRSVIQILDVEEAMLDNAEAEEPVGWGHSGYRRR